MSKRSMEYGVLCTGRSEVRNVSRILIIECFMDAVMDPVSGL